MGASNVEPEARSVSDVLTLCNDGRRMRTEWCKYCAELSLRAPLSSSNDTQIRHSGTRTSLLFPPMCEAELQIREHLRRGLNLNISSGGGENVKFM